MMTAVNAGSPPPYNAVVKAIHRVRAGAAEIFILRVAPPAGFAYQAGQYVEVGFGGLQPRPYSLANAPGEDALELHIKRTAGEAGLFVASILQTGDAITLSAPQGDNIFDPGETRPLLVVAGGMGLTPAKALIEAALRHNPAAAVTFFWGTRSSDEQYLRAYFEDMAAHYDGFSFHPVAGIPVGDALAGFYAAPANLSGHRIYLSGPPPMIAAILPQLQERGADPVAISYDRRILRQDQKS